MLANMMDGRIRATPLRRTDAECGNVSASAMPPDGRIEVEKKERRRKFARLMCVCADAAERERERRALLCPSFLPEEERGILSRWRHHQ